MKIQKITELISNLWILNEIKHKRMVSIGNTSQQCIDKDDYYQIISQYSYEGHREVEERLEGIDQEIDELIEELHEISMSLQFDPAYKAQCAAFVASLEELDDPILTALFSQAKVINTCNEEFEIRFEKKFKFLEDLIRRTRPQWAPLFHEAFGNTVVIDLSFLG